MLFGPDKWRWFGVRIRDEVVDRIFELLDGTEDPSLEAPLA
jgi:hypothetical protein